jgi:hypothetical protein
LLLGKWAEIEVASPDIGDQILAEWLLKEPLKLPAPAGVNA